MKVAIVIELNDKKIDPEAALLQLRATIKEGGFETVLDSTYGDAYMKESDLTVRRIE